MRIEGKIIVCAFSACLSRANLSHLFQGFDEFMNLVIDEAAEIYVKDAKPRRELGTPVTDWFVFGILIISAGRILLKGDNITLIQQTT